jgi:hypothetical protein
VELHDPTAIALITDLRGLSMLTPFLTDAHTLSSAAKVLRRSPSTLAHWVPRFVAAGVLEVVEVQRRAGAPMPRYRTAARKFVIPFGLIPFDVRVRMLDEGRLRMLRRFMDGMDESLAAGTVGLSFTSYGDGGTAIELEETDTRRAARDYTDGWRTLDLTEDDAIALGREIEALIRRYEGRRGPKKFHCHAGIAPEPAFPWRSANDRWS